MRIQFYLIAFMILISSNILNARIFSLFSQMSGNANLATTLSEDEVLSESIQINGYDTTMRVSIVNETIRNYFEILKKNKTIKKIKINGNSIQYSTIDGEMKTAHYITQVDPNKPSVHFWMRLPKELDKNKISQPPEYIPIGLNIIRMKSSLLFKDRGSEYYEFDILGESVYNIVEHIINNMSGHSWQLLASPTHNPNKIQITSTLLNNSEHKMAVISVIKKMQCITCYVYIKPFKK